MSFIGHLIIAMVIGQLADPAEADCVTCHTKVTPGVVKDWKLSAHGESNVSCDVCHGDAHKSAEDVANVRIPTPETCDECHGEYHGYSYPKCLECHEPMHAASATPHEEVIFDVVLFSAIALAASIAIFLGLALSRRRSEA